MVYERYVYKRGRRYGPYYYESYRYKNKVKKIYIGGKKEYKEWLKKQDREKRRSKSRTTLSLFQLLNKQRKWVLVVPLTVLLIFIAVFLIHHPSITGKISLDIQDSYVYGENLSGTLKLRLTEGELLPIDSKLVLSYGGGVVKEISMSEIIEPNFEGDFYVEGANISGSGKGYGFLGEKITYPI